MNRNSSSFIPGFPAVKQIFFGINLGVTLDYLFPLRALVEYLPLFNGHLHHNYRIALAWVF